MSSEAEMRSGSVDAGEGPQAIQIPKDGTRLGFLIPGLLALVALVGVVALTLPVSVMVSGSNGDGIEIACGSPQFPETPTGVSPGFDESIEELQEGIRRYDACADAQDPRFYIGWGLIGAAAVAGVAVLVMVFIRKGREAAKRPCWRVDPANRHEMRWWNGDSWTDTVSDAGVVSKDAIGEAVK